jgi:hypothetical protein
VNDRSRVRGVTPARAPSAAATQGHQALQVVHDGSSAECAPCSSPRKHARGRFPWSERVCGQWRGRTADLTIFSRPGLSAMLTSETQVTAERNRQSYALSSRRRSGSCQPAGPKEVGPLSGRCERPRMLFACITHADLFALRA